jgi:hypothetical protein
MTTSTSLWRIFLLRAHGLPVRLWRRVKRTSKNLVAPSRYLPLLKIRARWLGVHVATLQTDMDQVKQYDPVGSCVYCTKSPPEVKLSREHILAYSLGGDAILPDSCCAKCQRIIHEFETYCAEHIFMDIRVHHDVHSRSGRRSVLPVYSKASPDLDEKDKILVPIKDHPGWLIMPSFDIPGIFDNRAGSDRFPTVTIHAWSITNIDQQKKKWAKFGIKDAWTMRKIDPKLFGRMIAKIAHCTAIAYMGPRKFKPLLKETILEGKNIPHYVGSATDRTPEPVPMKTWARVEIRKIRNKKYVVVFFRLFAYVKAEQSEKGTPVYSVVVGEFIPWWDRLASCIGWPRHSTDKNSSLSLREFFPMELCR